MYNRFMGKAENNSPRFSRIQSILEAGSIFHDRKRSGEKISKRNVFYCEDLKKIELEDT